MSSFCGILLATFFVNYDRYNTVVYLCGSVLESAKYSGIH